MYKKPKRKVDITEPVVYVKKQEKKIYFYVSKKPYFLTPVPWHFKPWYNDLREMIKRNTSDE